MKYPDGCNEGLKNVHIMKDALGQKNILTLKGSSAHVWCNIKLKCIVHERYSQSLTFSSFGIVYIDCRSFSLFSYVIVYNTQH